MSDDITIPVAALGGGGGLLGILSWIGGWILRSHEGRHDGDPQDTHQAAQETEGNKGTEKWLMSISVTSIRTCPPPIWNGLLAGWRG